MKATDMAYAAGFFDGEGHVECRKNQQGYRNIQAMIGQNEIAPLEWLKILFGGHIYHPHGKKKSNAHQWVVNGYDAAKFFEAILPYLMVKEAEVKEALEDWVASKRDSS